MNGIRFLIALALLGYVVPAHAQKTKAALNTEITTNWPDNTTGAITPSLLRSTVADVVNSIMPTAPVVSGNLACFNGTTGLLQDCGSAPNIFNSGVTFNAAITYGGVTLANAVTGTGNMVLSSGPSFTGPIPIFGPSASALSVGLNGGTNPAFNVDASTALQVAGLNVKGAVTGGTVAVTAIDSGAATNLTIDAKGSGTLGIAGASTGAASIAKVTITRPATGSTLTIADGKTLTSNNSLTLAGTDSTTMTFPGTSASIARTDAGQTFTGTQTVGALLANSTAGVGYTTGAGSAVTQLTNRATSVTINAPTGAITMFNAAGSATVASFTVSNSAVAATDVIHLNQKSGTNIYNLLVSSISAGSFVLAFYTTGGTATDSPVINFAVIKGSAS